MRRHVQTVKLCSSWSHFFECKCETYPLEIELKFVSNESNVRDNFLMHRIFYGAPSTIFFNVISIATCKPNSYLFIDSEVSLTCSFYNNYKFSIAQKMLCTPGSQIPLTSSRLCYLGNKRPRRQFFSRYIKE
jgi:hypothetical protein